MSSKIYLNFHYTTTMNTQQPMEDRLWNYIDGGCSPAEKSAIETLIATNREWQEKYRELLNIHQLLNASELEAPSMRFTKNVMEEIARYQIAPATKSYINKNVIRGIGAFFLTMIAGLLAFVFSQFKWSSGSQSSNSIKLPSANDLGLDQLNRIDYSKTFNSTWVIGFMLVLVVMSWMLLDMYLQQKNAAPLILKLFL
ncbi:anti-sigma factor family protein [Puia sp. P3]|uniref:anti-sigma factor family protein n=1 Tax=Puia sp. P3 TaxID=3423952 RepID=UPI003D667B88